MRKKLFFGQIQASLTEGLLNMINDEVSPLSGMFMLYDIKGTGTMAATKPKTTDTKTQFRYALHEKIRIIERICTVAIFR